MYAYSEVASMIRMLPCNLWRELNSPEVKINEKNHQMSIIQPLTGIHSDQGGKRSPYFKAWHGLHFFHRPDLKPFKTTSIFAVHIKSATTGQHAVVFQSHLSSHGDIISHRCVGTLRSLYWYKQRYLALFKSQLNNYPAVRWYSSTWHILSCFCGWVYCFMSFFFFEKWKKNKLIDNTYHRGWWKTSIGQKREQLHGKIYKLLTVTSQIILRHCALHFKHHSVNPNTENKSW